jgi:hypothetical protein
MSFSQGRRRNSLTILALFKGILFEIKPAEAGFISELKSTVVTLFDACSFSRTRAA